MWHVWGRREVPTGLWWEPWTDVHHLEDYGVDVDGNIKMDPKEIC